MCEDGCVDAIRFLALECGVDASKAIHPGSDVRASEQPKSWRVLIQVEIAVVHWPGHELLLPVDRSCPRF
jgi:hypothetical protein